MKAKITHETERVKNFFGTEYRDAPKTKGGAGSGNFNHAGRPGKVGGSAPNNSPNLEASSRPTGISKFLPEKTDFDKKYKTVTEYTEKYTPRIKEVESKLSGLDKEQRALGKELRAMYRNYDTPQDWQRTFEIKKRIKDIKKEKNAELIRLEKISDEMRLELNAKGDDSSVKFDAQFFGDVQLMQDTDGVLKEMSDSGFFRKDLIGDKKVTVQGDVGSWDSSYYSQKEKQIVISQGRIRNRGLEDFRYCVYHEMGHWIQDNSPEKEQIDNKLVDFFKRRTGSQTPKLEYGALFLPDKFISSYVGRLYAKLPSKHTINIDIGKLAKKEGAMVRSFFPEEILSTGIEYITSKPAYFLMKDPEHFAITASILMGVPEK